MPLVFNGSVSRWENAVSSNRASACRFFARPSMSCSTFQLVDPPSRSVCGDVSAEDFAAGPSKKAQMRNTLGSLNHRLLLFCPKIIEVEPVVGCQATVVFQAIGVALGPLLNLLVSMLSIDRDLLGEQLEMLLVTIPSTVEPEEKD